ncbi:uncharacterized protein LOC113457843 [Microtus ochrogaster]|uniref:Uncharacterized protein LOC113457843 n=1 Tax=Microtus ochrogaster TaxID=79684 RepID=A0ABM1UM74_MICOH|nr:uncharacterized protein LOC113457843 [Microtus ochrogaster]
MLLCWGAEPEDRGHPLPSGAVSETWSLKLPSPTYHTLNLDRAVPSDPSSGRKEKAGSRERSSRGRRRGQTKNRRGGRRACPGVQGAPSPAVGTHLGRLRQPPGPHTRDWPGDGRALSRTPGAAAAAAPGLATRIRTLQQLIVTSQRGPPARVSGRGAAANRRRRMFFPRPSAVRQRVAEARDLRPEPRAEWSYKGAPARVGELVGLTGNLARGGLGKKLL